MTKAVSEQSLKIKYYSRNGTYPEMMVLVHFGPNLPQGNPKFFKKNKFLPLWYNTSPRFHINHRIIKFFKKNHLFGQKWTFKVKNRTVYKDHELQGQDSTTFSEFPNSELTDDDIPVLVSFFFTFIPSCFDFVSFLVVMPKE